MRITKKTRKALDEVQAIICNMCGEPIERNAFGYFSEHLTIEKQWGFSSAYDGETHSIELCQNCYEKLLSQLSVPHTTVSAVLRDYNEINRLTAK